MRGRYLEQGFHAAWKALCPAHPAVPHLVFAENERGPDDDLALQFEAVSQFSEEEKQTVRDLLEGLILKHTARRWDSTRAAAAVPAKKPADASATG